MIQTVKRLFVKSITHAVLNHYHVTWYQYYTFIVNDVILTVLMTFMLSMIYVVKHWGCLKKKSKVGGVPMESPLPPLQFICWYACIYFKTPIDM